MNSLILRVGVFVLIVAIIYIFLKKRKGKESDEYIWVGNGEDPFKKKEE